MRRFYDRFVPKGCFRRCSLACRNFLVDATQAGQALVVYILCGGCSFLITTTSTTTVCGVLSPSQLSTTLTMAAILDIFGLTDNDALNDSTFDKQAFDLSLMGTEHYAKEKVKLVEAMHYNGPMPKPEKTGSELITEALNSLSLKEREKIDNDVNGTGLDMMSSDPDATTGMPRNDVELSSFEDPNYQREKLREMETELKRQRDGNSWKLQMVAIEMAETQNLNYVQDPRLRLRFLRCDNWNVEAAASRFIRHFDWKLELFGEEKLTKDIGLEDLQAEDVNMLKKGYMQRLPARDRAGRCVFTSIYNGQKYPSPESLVRTMKSSENSHVSPCSLIQTFLRLILQSRQMYFMACGDDDETDRNGIVMLFFKIRLPQFSKDQSISSYINTYRAVTDMPVRVVATHKMLEVGTPGISRMQRLMDSAVSFIAPSARARLRLYYGTLHVLTN